MILKINDIDVEIDNFTEIDYQTVQSKMANDFKNGDKNRIIIKNAFELAFTIAPESNPSDIWHHIIYRLYIENLSKYKRVSDPKQSWVRSSGDALELFICDYYNQFLYGKGLGLIPVSIKKKDAIEVLKTMNLYGKVGNSKIDIAIIKLLDKNRPVSLDNGEILGGVHSKVSLAERVTDDVPVSLLMMEAGYKSYLFTLDVKSFPPSETISDKRAYVNQGELGSPDKHTDKRKYIEEHGNFDACFSYNLRTVPSPEKTVSGKKIYVGSFNKKYSEDPFYQAIVSLII